MTEKKMYSVCFENHILGWIKLYPHSKYTCLFYIVARVKLKKISPIFINGDTRPVSVKSHRNCQFQTSRMKAMLVVRISNIRIERIMVKGKGWHLCKVNWHREVLDL